MSRLLLRFGQKLRELLGARRRLRLALLRILDFLRQEFLGMPARRPLALRRSHGPPRRFRGLRRGLLKLEDAPRPGRRRRLRLGPQRRFRGRRALAPLGLVQSLSRRSL